MRTWMQIGLLAMFGALAACGPKAKHQCASNTTGHCLMGERCTYDKSRDCQVCICEPLDGNGTNPNRQDSPLDPPPLSEP